MQSLKIEEIKFYLKVCCSIFLESATNEQVPILSPFHSAHYGEGMISQKEMKSYLIKENKISQNMQKKIV